MARYLVHAISKHWHSLEVEAADPGDAIAKATAAPENEWTADTDYPEWEVAPDGTEDAELIDARD